MCKKNKCNEVELHIGANVCWADAMSNILRSVTRGYTTQYVILREFHRDDYCVERACQRFQKRMEEYVKQNTSPEDEAVVTGVMHVSDSGAVKAENDCYFCIHYRGRVSVMNIGTDMCHVKFHQDKEAVHFVNAQYLFDTSVRNVNSLMNTIRLKELVRDGMDLVCLYINEDNILREPVANCIGKIIPTMCAKFKTVYYGHPFDEENETVLKDMGICRRCFAKTHPNGQEEHCWHPKDRDKILKRFPVLSEFRIASKFSDNYIDCARLLRTNDSDEVLFLVNKNCPYFMEHALTVLNTPTCANEKHRKYHREETGERK